MLSQKEKELLIYASKYLLGADLSEIGGWTQEDINTLNDLWLKLQKCKDILIINSLPEIKRYDFICGLKSKCPLQEFNESVKHNICKINNMNCMELYPI